MSDVSRPEYGSHPPQREPVFNLPAVITMLIALFLGIQIIRDYWLTFETDIEIVRKFAFIPGRISNALDPAAIAAELTRLAGNSSRFQVARYFLGDGSMQPWSVVTYAFLHGDFVHAAMNSVWLAIFGAPVARRIGTLRFLALFIVTAIAGVAAHFAFHNLEFVPVVGASASVSGAMAAAVRFVFQPGGPLGPAVQGWQLPPEYSARLPALPLNEVIRDRRVMQFILIWFGINLLFGLFSVQLGATSSTVAWEAHVGGFVAGFLLFQLFDPPAPDPEILAGFHRPPRF